MKIMYVITKSNWGGAQRHVFDLAKAMKEKGHEVYVALGGNGLLQQKLESAGIFTYPVLSLGRDVNPGKDAGSFKEIWHIIKNKKPDVLHLHSPKAAGLGSVAGRLLGIKSIITTIHGWTFNENRPLHQKIGIIFFSWLTMLLSHKTILLSERDYSQTLYFPWVKKKLKLIPLGIIPHVFISVDGAKQIIGKNIGMDLNVYNKKITIGTIAELHPNKGLFYLINAMQEIVKKFPQAISIIIGEGEDKEKLINLIKEKNLENNVYLIGYIDQAGEYLKAFNIFALPSLKEGLPYVLLEAGCASLPVVSTPVGGIPEIVEDMKSGILIQSKNTKELAHGLSFMIEHPEERRKYGNALRERVINKFSFDKMIESLNDLYTKGI